MNRGPRNAVREQDPKVRATNFEEVSLGFDEKTMLDEADRCLNCKNAPCVKGCPVGVRIPEFISALKSGNPLEANRIIKSTNSLPAVCGRVCPQEVQCEKRCVRLKAGGSVAIGALERYSADFALRHERENEVEIQKAEKIDLKVAVIGSGPSSLSCAGELQSNGASVTVFEAFHKAGGVLVYGIPEFRLPKSIVNEEIDKLKKLGVAFKMNTVIGKTFYVEELLEEYDYVFIGSGAGLPQFMNIKGENLPGVYSANEFLTRVNLMGAYLKDSPTPVTKARKVVVVGGGNVAMDAARTALRMGAEKVYIAYRRRDEDMPARREEVHHAKEEGIEFLVLCAPTEVLGKEKVEGIKLTKMQVIEDEEGAIRAIPAHGTEFSLECDQVIVSIGTSPNPLIINSVKGLDVTERGTIKADDKGRTSIDRVYAGGDAVTGAATIILAMGAGRTAAQDMLSEFKNR